MALLTAVSLWLSAGTVAVIGGDTHRVAALPSVWILAGARDRGGRRRGDAAKLRLEESWPLAITLLLWLPFLPGRLPPAFLIWQGPIEAFVWPIAIARPDCRRGCGRCLPFLRESESRVRGLPARSLAWRALAAFSQVRGVIPGGDEPHYLAATQSLLEDFDLRVANNYADGDYLDYFPGRLEPHFLKRATSGEIYSIHAPGVSVIVLPAFAVAGYAGAVADDDPDRGADRGAHLAAGVAWCRAAWRARGPASPRCLRPRRTSFIPSRSIRRSSAASASRCGAWLLIDLADGSGSRHPDDWSRPAPRWRYCRGCTAGLRSRGRSWHGHRRCGSGRGDRRLSRLRDFLSVPAIAGAAWFAFFWMIWGTPSPMAPYGADTSTSSAYILRGLIGLLVDQQFGVLTTAPSLRGRDCRSALHLAGYVLGWPSNCR